MHMADATETNARRCTAASPKAPQSITWTRPVVTLCPQSRSDQGSRPTQRGVRTPARRDGAVGGRLCLVLGTGGEFVCLCRVGIATQPERQVGTEPAKRHLRLPA